jgi:hypothetical protein
MPTERKITMEILYNKYDILQNYLTYILASILMLFFTIVQIFKENKLVRILVNTMHVVVYYLRCTRLLWRHVVGLFQGMRPGVMLTKRLFM